ncbi:nuclear protein Sth1p/NPS1 [Diutina catenulata]
MNGNGTVLAPSDRYPTPPVVEFPLSRSELNHLLDRYYRLLKISKDDPQFDPMHPAASELEAMERVLAQVSQQQQRLEDEEAAFFADLDAADPVGEIDSDLLSAQVAGLQVLSRDLDLPPGLQRTFSDPEQTPPPEESDLLEWEPDFEKRARRYGITAERREGLAPETVIVNKISTRVAELAQVPANLGTFHLSESSELDKLKISSLVELKSLRLLPKQKQLKHQVLVHEAFQAKYFDPNLKNHPLSLQERRGFHVRAKVEQPSPNTLALQLEELQRQAAGRAEHQQHVNKINQILQSSMEIQERQQRRLYRRTVTLPKHVNAIHQTVEKDESKKLEKTAKQRLQALKANDEEAYLKLLDQTKDHRITHLLKQTNSFLDTLANQVRAQQAEADGEDEAIDDENREKIDYYQVAHRIKEDITKQPSILVGGQLKEYQLKGLQWMVSLYNNKLNGILADEMGLGKTIQSISLVSYLIEKKGESKFLVIVPLSTITNWTLEFEKWAPSIRVIVYKGSPQQRKTMQAEIRVGNFQVLLTTYEYIIRERPILAKFNYSHMIIDEGHRMKNTQSKLSVTLRQYYKTKNRLILTGTPLQNNLPELWALLNFVLPKIFNSVKSFDEWFNTPFANTGSQEKIELTEEESLLVIRRLHKVLRPFLLRRLKKDVEKDLPDKVEKVIKCRLSGLQQVLYQQMLKHNALFVGAEVTGQKSGIKGLNNKIMQLRKICNHPFVFSEVEEVLNSSRLTNDLIWRVSGKFEMLDRILPKFKASGHRVLMFFQMTQVMDIMEDFLRWRDMRYLRLDGSTKADERQDMLKEFNAPNSDYFCFLLSTRAGGLGLNLQTADTVIIFDTDWNPHQDLQAQDRAHRIGQKNEVRILRLITNDSVEEVILERAHQKLDIDGKVIQAGKFDNKSTAEEQEEFLKRLLEEEQTREEDADDNFLDEEELNDILARNEDEKELFESIDDNQKILDKQQGIKSRLIEDSELPSIFTEDITKHFEEEKAELGRVREKKRVKYDDGLSEEQWLMAIDDDNDTIEDAIKRNEARKRKRVEGEPAVILEEISELVADDGHAVSEVFEKLPSKKLYPDYYTVITQPVALETIRKKVKQGHATAAEVVADLKVMVANARTYNDEGSWVWDDADAVQSVIDRHDK